MALVIVPDGNIAHQVTAAWGRSGAPDKVLSAAIFGDTPLRGDSDTLVIVDVPSGPTPSTKRAITKLLQSGHRRVAVVLVHSEGTDDEELHDIVEMEVRELISAHGIADDEVAIIDIPESSLIERDQTFKALADHGFHDRDASADSHSTVERPDPQLDEEALVAIHRAPGLRVDQPSRDLGIRASVVAAEVRPNLWWAPTFQFLPGSQSVNPLVSEVSYKLGGRDDPAGALSWWLTPNPWIGNVSPADLVSSGRDVDLEIRFAADQVRNGAW